MPYPATIVQDRYTGAYSGGRWLAFNMDADEIPSAISDDDNTCAAFWADVKYGGSGPVVGIGETPNEALVDLVRRLEWVK